MNTTARTIKPTNDERGHAIKIIFGGKAGYISIEEALLDTVFSPNKQPLQNVVLEKLKALVPDQAGKIDTAHAGGYLVQLKGEKGPAKTGILFPSDGDINPQGFTNTVVVPTVQTAASLGSAAAGISVAVGAFKTAAPFFALGALNPLFAVPPALWVAGGAVVGLVAGHVSGVFGGAALGNYMKREEGIFLPLATETTKVSLETLEQGFQKAQFVDFKAYDPDDQPKPVALPVAVDHRAARFDAMKI